MLVLARIVQGLATGGEALGPDVPGRGRTPQRRGLWSSVIYIAGVGGNTIGVLLGLVLSLTLTPAQMTEFGWRIPFVVGGVLGLVALWIRRSLGETEAFTREAAADPGARPRIWPGIVRHRREAAQVIGLSVGFTVVYYSW